MNEGELDASVAERAICCWLGLAGALLAGCDDAGRAAPVDGGPDVPDAAVGAAERSDAGDGADEAGRRGHPLDDVLRLNHLQLAGTHNSYHVAPPDPPPSLRYEHAPLAEQLDEQGIRHLELDLWLEDEAYRVRHAPVYDTHSRCPELSDCLDAVASWSEAHPGHLPVVVLFELKDAYGEVADEQPHERLEATVGEAFEAGGLITPDELRGEAASVAAAVEAAGWPTLAEARGRVVAAMMSNDGHGAAYSDDFQTLEGRRLFVLAPPETPVAAMVKRDNPRGERREAIRELVRSGRLVRTRADVPDDAAWNEGDTSRRDAALSSGAQLVSTDLPVPRDGVDYVMRLVEGDPDAVARCNPVTAPAACRREALAR